AEHVNALTHRTARRLHTFRLLDDGPVGRSLMGLDTPPLAARPGCTDGCKSKRRRLNGQVSRFAHLCVVSVTHPWRWNHARGWGRPGCGVNGKKNHKSLASPPPRPKVTTGPRPPTMRAGSWASTSPSCSSPSGN